MFIGVYLDSVVMYLEPVCGFLSLSLVCLQFMLKNNLNVYFKLGIYNLPL